MEGEHGDKACSPISYIGQQYLMRKLICLLTSVLALSLHAQETGESSVGAWYMYFGKNQVSEDFSIHTEAQFRYYETTKNFNQLLLRTGVNYELNQNAMATLGYGYIETDPNFSIDPLEDFPPSNTVEHRIFEQFIFKNKIWELLVQHRFRLEQRFIENTDFSTTDTKHRSRYRLQVTIPFTDVFFVNLYNEVFLNLSDDNFDQNRLYAALGLNITQNSSIQIGFLKHYFSTRTFDRLQVGIFYNPDLRGVFNKK